MNWREFLYASNVLGDLSEDEVAALKRDFQKGQKTDWQKSNRQNQARIEIRLEKHCAYPQLKLDAKAHGLSVPKYLLACYHSAKANHWVQPAPGKANSLLVQQNRIGNNINQMVRKAHSDPTISNAAILRIHALQLELKDHITEALKQEPLTVLIREALAQNPRTLLLILPIVVRAAKQSGSALKLLSSLLDYRNSKPQQG